MSEPLVADPIAQEEVKTRHCPRYKVFLHNDPVTPMNVVTAILRGVFALDARRSRQVMLEAHEQEVAFVTALPLEQAEFRVEQAHALARGAGYPLTLSYEPE